MSVEVQVHEDERYPYCFVKFRDDEEDGEFGTSFNPIGFSPNVELSDDDAADLRRVRAEHEAWQRKLRKLCQGGQPSAY